MNSKDKNRLIVLTDISGGLENDDIESMHRLLLYSNEIDIEGLIATTSCWKKRTSDRLGRKYILKLIDAYERVKPNLDIHAEGYPVADALRGVTCTGISVFGAAMGRGFGEEKYNDNPGVNLIIGAVDKADERPLWIALWGGANTLAQAVWRVQTTRSAAELNSFLGKLRINAISDQDSAGHWLRRQFGDRLFYIVSPSPASGSKTYYRATWPGISADHALHGSEDGTRGGGFSGADAGLVSKAWLKKNIRQGAYGRQYPVYRFIMEGDTPSYLNLIPNGLGSPEHPDFGSWGGRYEYYIPDREYTGVEEKYPVWTNASDEVSGLDNRVHHSAQATIWRWREACQHDFQARVCWTITDDYTKANHPPVARLDHPGNFTVKSGQPVALSAEGSFDPDGYALVYQWIYYREAGTFDGDIDIANAENCCAEFTAPVVDSSVNLHVIVAVTDDGQPCLTRYKRVIIAVSP